MAIQTIELFRTGRGFRVAFHAKKFRLNKSRTFSDIDSLLEKLLEVISNTPPDYWQNLTTSGQIQSELPEIGNRTGDLEFWPVTDKTDDQVVIARCSISFRLWPFGGWTAYDGIRFSDGRVIWLTDDELSKWW